MSEDSESRLTVTLGRSGRVVKRLGREPDAAFSGSVSGSKRSVKDRLGTSVGDDSDDRSLRMNKRQREEHNEERSDWDSSNDTHLGSNDLRFKLRQKTESRQFQNEDPSGNVDLRVLLSSKVTLPPADRRRSYSPEPIIGTRKGMLEPRDRYYDQRPSMEYRPYNGERQGIREPRDTSERQSLRELRGVYSTERQSLPERRDCYDVERRSLRERRDCDDVERRRMPESRAAYGVERESIREPRDTYRGGRPTRLESRDDYDNGRRCIPGPVSSRTGRDLPITSHARTSYPSWTLDNIRRRSPDRIPSSSKARTFSPDRIPSSSKARTFSPDRYMEERHRRAFVRTYDDGKSNGYQRNEAPSPQRATGSAVIKKQSSSAALPSMSVKGAPVNMQFRVPNPPTVDRFLQSLGLEKYVISFKAEEVDFNALRQMSDFDLKDLGIPMGPRKKILQALLPRTSSKPREAHRP